MEQKKQDNPFEEGAKTPQEETIALTVDGQELTLTMEQLVQAGRPDGGQPGVRVPQV